jgi:hypothetical protein
VNDTLFFILFINGAIVEVSSCTCSCPKPSQVPVLPKVLLTNINTKRKAALNAIISWVVIFFTSDRFIIYYIYFYFIMLFIMRTSIWGPIYWRALHSLVHVYDGQKKREYKELFNLLYKLIPCAKCRKHYRRVLPISNHVFKSHESLTRWLYDLHKNINTRVAEIKKIAYNPPTYQQYINNGKLRKDHVGKMVILVSNLQLDEKIKLQFWLIICEILSA